MLKWMLRRVPFLLAREQALLTLPVPAWLLAAGLAMAQAPELARALLFLLVLSLRSNPM